ncbi:MAG: MltA domain-containing protein [Legionella sp.]|nr:MltA domain-containing protein [Legionella sp.]
MKIKFLYLLIIITTIFSGFAVFQQKTEIITLKQSSFQKLPGWESADIKKSLQTFQVSCKAFLRQDPERPVGSQQINMKVKDWLPACRAALAVEPSSDSKARDFFQRWFKPVEFYTKQSVSGLFTGYYLPLLHGSLTKTPKYNIPVYGLPQNIVTINLDDFGSEFGHRRIVGRIENNKVLPFHTREEINKGVLKNKAPVLVWVDSHIDRLFLEIQGSGVVQLENGDQLNLGYAGENGASYTPVGKVLVDRGVMTKKTASMQGIREYLEAHPEEIVPVINQNKSFVFFRILDRSAALGAQGVTLTPGYSLAVDRKWIPLGTPLWLDTTRPSQSSQKPKPLQRLMVAQDTGGAIRGTVRGDVFWGAGENATYIAGKMKNPGHYWLLLPRHKIPQLPPKFN